MLTLEERLLIGKGCTQTCYKHPQDSGLCVKIVHKSQDKKHGQKDVDREIAYREMLDKKDKDYSILAKYYGTEPTNLGEGYVYERIVDADGCASRPLSDYLRSEVLLKNNFTKIVASLKDLKNGISANEIVTMSLGPPNILMQNFGETFKARIVDDIGSNDSLPLAYWFGTYAKVRASYKWAKFKKHIVKKFADGSPDEAIRKLVKQLAREI